MDEHERGSEPVAGPEPVAVAVPTAAPVAFSAACGRAGCSPAGA
jgi:hypothetical protein